MADGSIVIDTKIDQSGLDKQVESVKSNLKAIGDTKLSPDMSGVKNSLRGVTDHAKIASGGFEGIKSKLASSFPVLAGAALAYTALAGAIKAVIGTIIDFAAKARQFNSELANIATLIPGNTQRIREMQYAIEDMSASSGKSLSELSKTTYDIVSAFGDTADTMKILEISSKAATAGLSTTTESLGLLSAVSKAYGDTSAETIQKISDLGLLTVRLGKTTFPELATAIQKVTPAAAALGVSMEELFAMEATLTGVTGNADIVSTQLKAAFGKMMSPTEDLIKVFDELGVKTGQEFVAKVGGANEALNAIAQYAEQTNTPLAKLLGSEEAVAAALALTGSQADNFNRKMAEMQNSAGTTETAFGEAANGINKWGFKINAFAQVWEQLKVSIGRLFESDLGILSVVFNKIVSGITDIIDVFGAFKNFYYNSFLAPIVEGFVYIRDEIYDAFAGRILKSMREAFQYLADVAQKFWYVIGGKLKTAFVEIRTAVGELWDSLKELLPNLDAATLKFAAAEAVSRGFAAGIISASFAISTAVTGIKLLIKLLNMLVQNFKNSQAVLSAGINAIMNPSRASLDALKDAVRSSAGTVKEMGAEISSEISAYTKRAKGDWNAFWDAINGKKQKIVLPNMGEAEKKLYKFGKVSKETSESNQENIVKENELYDEMADKLEEIAYLKKLGLIDDDEESYRKIQALQEEIDRLVKKAREQKHGGDEQGALQTESDIEVARKKLNFELLKMRNQTMFAAGMIGLGIPEEIAYHINEGIHAATEAVKFLVENIANAFSNAWELFSDVFNFMIDFNPMEMFDNFKVMIDGLIEFFNKDLGSIPIFAQMALNLVKDFISAITKNLPVLITTIENVIDEVLSFIVDNADAIVSAFFNVVVAIIGKLAEKFPDIVEAFIKVLLVVLERLTEIAPEIVSSIIQALTEAFVVIAQNAAFIARAVGKLIMVIATSLIENFPMIVEALAEGMPQLAVAFAVEFPIAMAKEMPNLIKALIIAMAQMPSALAKGLYKGMRDAGKNLILGLVDGIMEAPALWESTKKKFSEFIDKIKEFFKINSPSRVMYDIGRNLIFGLINGIKSAFSLIYSIASSIGSAFMSALTSGIKATGSLISLYLLDSLQSAVNNLFYNLKDTVWSWITGWFSNIASGVWGYIKDKVKDMLPGRGGGFFGGLFASGTNDAPGGLAVVGEEGPELIELPAHSRVYTADETKAMMSVRKGISSLTGGMMPSLTSTPSQVINLNNNLIATIVADGREIGRAAFKYIDKFAGAAYGY